MAIIRSFESVTIFLTTNLVHCVGALRVPNSAKNNPCPRTVTIERPGASMMTAPKSLGAIDLENTPAQATRPPPSRSELTPE
ncbi:MAG: hypothetical protein MI923_29435 [Phycisphaerales bacterium]|nr:hypothetical protein [Phycisphaerales bacterium]